jgi:hypothetical protein
MKSNTATVAMSHTSDMADIPSTNYESFQRDSKTRESTTTQEITLWTETITKELVPLSQREIC